MAENLNRPHSTKFTARRVPQRSQNAKDSGMSHADLQDGPDGDV
jgi:hypothetical protein